VIRTFLSVTVAKCKPLFKTGGGVHFKGDKIRRFNQFKDSDHIVADSKNISDAFVDDLKPVSV
jgi:hypothetical protein